MSPEEEELAAKREELARFHAELSERELALASRKAELAAFEGLYLRRVGVLYAELDEGTARLAELRAEQAGTAEAKTEASKARSQAKESYSAAHGEAAKRTHPDTATDEADHLRRERIMKEVNAAYAAGDDDALRRILADLQISPDAVQGSDIGAALVRVLRQLRQIRNRIAAIDLEIANLSKTDYGQAEGKG